MYIHGMKLIVNKTWTLAILYPGLLLTKSEFEIHGNTRLRITNRCNQFGVVGFGLEGSLFGFGFILGWANYLKNKEMECEHGTPYRYACDICDSDTKQGG